VRVLPKAGAAGIRQRGSGGSPFVPGRRTAQWLRRAASPHWRLAGGGRAL